ncbi:NAC domain-containing protein 78 [Spatholobus suberectus]|nr:NAC domain-containing protein 78 [Spatholobus suberectus]
MLDEYLAIPDDDVCNYISFDSPQIPESENAIPIQGSPFIQQNVEGETTDNAVASNGAQSSNEASSVQNPQEAKLVPGNTSPLVKQAYGWLASIPAAPAHALEFPAKEIALGLHPAAESSNSAHITTGMISITDITFRGNAMDWTMGKNGGFNAVMSTGFSQSDVNSAALMPISGLVSSKTAFVLSHGWIFVTGFSVLILSLSFMIGSIMYTGK